MKEGANRVDDLYRWLCDCAARGLACPSNEQIADRFGFESNGSAVRMVAALVQDGRISVEVWHSWRQVAISATGDKTAVMGNRIPHWRARERPKFPPMAPAPAVRIVSEAEPEISRAIAFEADRRGQPIQVFLSELVAIGWSRFAEMKVEGSV